MEQGHHRRRQGACESHVRRTSRQKLSSDAHDSVDANQGKSDHSPQFHIRSRCHPRLAVALEEEEDEAIMAGMLIGVFSSVDLLRRSVEVPAWNKTVLAEDLGSPD